MMQTSHKDSTGRSKTLVVVYYTGHGCLFNGRTAIVCNEEFPEMRYWPMERNIAAMSAYKNNFVLALFDCCREQVSPELCKGGLDIQSEQLEKGQLYQTFGCQATQGVKLNSTIAANYVESILSKVDKATGEVNILSAMKQFKRLEANAQHIDGSSVDSLIVKIGAPQVATKQKKVQPQPVVAQVVQR